MVLPETICLVAWLSAKTRLTGKSFRTSSQSREQNSAELGAETEMSTSNSTQTLILNQENDQKKHLPEQTGEFASAAGSVSQRDKKKPQEGLKI